MDMGGPGFFLMTLFNAAVCILLPRIVTLNWSQIINKFAIQISSQRQIAPEVSGENIPQV